MQLKESQWYNHEFATLSTHDNREHDRGGSAQNPATNGIVEVKQC